MEDMSRNREIPDFKVVLVENFMYNHLSKIYLPLERFLNPSLRHFPLYLSIFQV